MSDHNYYYLLFKNLFSSALVGVPSSSSSNRLLDERGRQTLKFELSTVEKPSISSTPTVADKPAQVLTTERIRDAAVDQTDKVDESELDNPSVEETEKVKKTCPL